MRVARFYVNLAARVVGEADAKFFVHRPLQLRIGICEDSHDVLEPGDQRLDFGCSEDLVRWLVPELAFNAAPLAVDLGDPVTDDRSFGATLKDVSISGELALAFLEASAKVEVDHFWVVGPQVGA